MPFQMPLLNKRAFTLVELMIALAIAGILTALTLEGHKALLARYQLQGVSRMLFFDLRMVQQQALATRRRHWVDFDPGLGSYSVWMTGADRSADSEKRLVRQTKLPGSVRFGAAPGVKGPPSDPEEITDPDGITFRNNRLVFMPGGGLGTMAGTVYLTEDSRDRQTHAITVTVSGHARLYGWTGSGWR
jgi:prepilin-type N-terminal cleavage/methylation domain-containing protein